MNADELKELEEIEQLVSDVYGLISVTKESCLSNDYSNEESALKYAQSLQHKAIEKVINLNMCSLP